jgi:AcrR family transcriptional regulator
LRKATDKKRGSKTRPPSAGSRQTRQRRAHKLEPAQRKQEILDAALSVFAERGFEAARLDDIAARAGVAKGTLYLYFADKEKLFEEVVRGAVKPIIERIGALAATADVSISKVLDGLFQVMEQDILATRRKLIIRLIVAEGPRFPRIAESYYRNVVGQVMPLVRTLAERAHRRRELPTDALVRYPQLVAAPLLLAVIWDALFQRIDPIDFGDLLSAYGEVLTAGKGRTCP